MFTGLIKEIGEVTSVQENTEGRIITIRSRELISDMGIDDSVSVNGACQTVISKTSETFTVQSIHTTLEKTTLGKLNVGEKVNLELALRLSDRLGGHLVQGHVNNIGKVVNIDQTGENYLVTVSVPQNLMKYFINEGSIAIDGISLTIAKVNRDQNTVTVSIIPHTWTHTVLHNRPVGSFVNLEVDMMAKYVENILFYKNEENSHKSVITEEWLSQRGF